MRTQLAALVASALILASCASPAPVAAPASFDPEDPAVTATLDSIVAMVRAGADAVNADQTLGPANPEPDLVFMAGDALIAGKDEVLKVFRDTYAQIRAQRHAPIARRVQLIAPDVAIYSALGRGTFQDLNGEVSEPVGLGTSAVFVRRDGVWRLAHMHQSVSP
jgi:ketosteroid isomerase-like protein